MKRVTRKTLDMWGIDERRSADFIEWESRGRGWQLWDFPVGPEPLFRPFAGHGVIKGDAISDDGRKPTFLSSLIRKASDRLGRDNEAANSCKEDRDQPAPEMLKREEIVELVAYLPQNLKFNREEYVDLFTSLRVCSEPVTFELIGDDKRIVTQLTVHPQDEPLLRRQLETFFPEVSFVTLQGNLASLWGELGSAYRAIVEFGLGKEFMIPLAGRRGDPLSALAGALSEVGPDELGLFQVIFQPTQHPWDESVLRSVSHADGKAFFVNVPELVGHAREKVSKPLYAAVVRIAAQSGDASRAWEIACNAAAALGVFGSATANELIPLSNDGYPTEDREADVLSRQTHRSGMLLNADELAGFVHLPSGEVKSSRLRHRLAKSKPAPGVVTNQTGIYLGENRHFGAIMPVSLISEQRVRHTHIIGASGTGKSTLLFNLIRQDIENGEGIGVLDPHGDLIDKVLGIIPEHRIKDVVLLDPSDEDHIVGFNILSAHSDWEKNLLASDLVSVFRRLSTSWGDQLASVLQNAILAFLESDRVGTLYDLRRFLLEPAYRNEFLSTVRDDNVVYYWRKGFPQLSGNKSVGSIITRLDMFLGPKPLRYMIAQGSNRLDFGDIMDTSKIFLAKLSQGAIGRENSFLLGSLLVAKIHQLAMSRQRQKEGARRDFWLYIDEFHDFLTASMAEILSGVRKYRLGLTLSHQELRQVQRDPDVASALLSNSYTRICFRVGDHDAKALESGFSAFEVKDIQNLGIGEAICRVERSEWDFNLSVDMPELPDAAVAADTKRRAIEYSRSTYATSRAEVEALLRKQTDVEATNESIKERKSAEAKAVALTSEIPPISLKEKAMDPPSEPFGTESNVSPASTSILAQTEISKSKFTQQSDLGRGGAQHQAIQLRIKDEAEKLGFRVHVEKQILDGAGCVDLHIERDGVVIACEVTVTTTIDHEVGNVSKCVKAGYSKIVMVAVSEEKLAKLQAAVINSLGEEIGKRVSYLLPDAFITKLRALPSVIQQAEPEQRTRGGRKVKRNFVPLPVSEAKKQEDTALRLIGEAMKRSQAR